MNQHYLIIGIIYMIPFLIMIGISISRKRLGTQSYTSILAKEIGAV